MRHEVLWIRPPPLPMRSMRSPFTNTSRVNFFSCDDDDDTTTTPILKLPLQDGVMRHGGGGSGGSRVRLGSSGSDYATQQQISHSRSHGMLVSPRTTGAAAARGERPTTLRFDRFELIVGLVCTLVFVDFLR